MSVSVGIIDIMNSINTCGITVLTLCWKAVSLIQQCSGITETKKQKDTDNHDYNKIHEIKFMNRSMGQKKFQRIDKILKQNTAYESHKAIQRNLDIIYKNKIKIYLPVPLL